MGQSNNVSVAGSTISGGGNSVNDGFVVRLTGAFLANMPIAFTYGNTTGAVQSVAFTTGLAQVPAPLPLMGAGVAFSFSRRLRRRIRA